LICLVGIAVMVAAAVGEPMAVTPMPETVHGEHAEDEHDPYPIAAKPVHDTTLSSCRPRKHLYFGIYLRRSAIAQASQS
jgi:hypothetical protein